MQLFKEPLVHSMHLHFRVYVNFFLQGQQLRNGQKAKVKLQVEVHQTTPPTRACAVCQLELRAETKSKKRVLQMKIRLPRITSLEVKGR